MSLLAINQNNIEVFADENVDKKDTFYCRHCKQRLSFVDAKLKSKHFRHLVSTNCDSEPETEEHILYKRMVYKTLLELNIGQPFLEPFSDKIYRPDIYLSREDERDIVFEVQGTNYSISLFEKKIAYYSNKGFIVIYLFIPGNFLCEPRENIYSLKEIEKRIFVEEIYKEIVLGAYINREKILLPSFQHKYAKGGYGYCSTRFIIQENYSRCIPLQQYLNEISTFLPKKRLKLVCNHEDYKYELVDKKIVRYKKVCKNCGKFIKWLSNEDARKLGLQIKSS